MSVSDMENSTDRFQGHDRMHGLSTLTERISLFDNPIIMSRLRRRNRELCAGNNRINGHQKL